MILHKSPCKLVELKIEVTHRCPLACIHCSSDATPESTKEMSKQECLSILSEAIEMGVKEVAFSGGEPLAWAGLDDAIKAAINGGLKVTIYTSGNIPNVNQRMGQLAEASVNRSIFSIFGANDIDHERITRIKGSFAATKHAISCAGMRGLEVELHFVPLASNFGSLEAIAHLASDLGVRRISVLRFVPQGRGVLIKNRALNKIQNLQLKKTIEKLRSEGFDIRTGSPYNFLMVNDQPKCSSGIDRLIIGPDLRIYPCDAFKQVKAEEIVGTLNLSVSNK